MKKIKYFAIVTSLFIATFIFFGCNDKSEVNTPNNFNLDSPEFALIDITDAQNAIDDATLDAPMAFNTSLYNYSFLSSSDFKPSLGTVINGELWMRMYNQSKHLGLVLKRLNLSDDQKVQVEGFMKEYHTSMKSLIQQYRAANQSIIENANLERKQIVEDVKSGKITRLEAKEKLKLLNENTRKLIAENESSLTVKTQMCDTTKNLLNEIGGILTSDQKVKWDVFVSKFKTPCD